MADKTRVETIVEALAQAFRACHAEGARNSIVDDLQRGLALIVGAANRLDASWLAVAKDAVGPIGFELAANQPKGVAALVQYFPELDRVAGPIGGLAQLVALLPVG